MTFPIENGIATIVQGMTGKQGMSATSNMIQAGTNIVAGVSPSKANTTLTFQRNLGVNGEPSQANAQPVQQVPVPVFADCRSACQKTGARASLVFVPASQAKDAIIEAIEAGITLIVVITEGIPVQDTMYCLSLAKRSHVRIIGPNCPGVLVMRSDKNGLNVDDFGVIPNDIASFGPVGLVSQSGTLTYQMMGELSDVGFTTCVGIGGDPVVGMTLLDVLKDFEADEETKAVLMIGQVGSDKNLAAARWAGEHATKPIVVYIAGSSLPQERQMGHGTSIVSPQEAQAAEDTRRVLEEAHILVADTPTEAAKTVRQALERTEQQ